MTVHLIATLEIRQGCLPRFMRAVGEMMPTLNAAGWTLKNAYAFRTGQLGTVIDIWEMADMNTLGAGFAALAADRRFPEFQAVLAETVNRETLAFADPLTYPPGG